jgi:phosphoribosylformylglycinamidine synthase
VVSGNVSLYNETDGTGILPTPAVAIVGLVPDASKTCGQAFRSEGDLIAVLGRTRGELGGSEWLRAFHDRIAGRPPKLDINAERALQALIRELVRQGLLSSAHDCSEGGLAVALAEACVSEKDRMLGATVTLDPGSVAPHAYLFGEDASRIVISFAPAQRQAVESWAARAKVPLAVVGQVGGTALRIEGLREAPVEAPVDAMSRAFRDSLPRIVQRPARA